MAQKIKNIAIVFGKEEESSFNRYTFPILGRPVAKYPLLAALNANEIQAVYLSTDSPSLIEIGKNIEGINLLIREKSQPTLTQEIRNAVVLIITTLGYTPSTVTVLLANSPCVIPSVIDNSIKILEKNTTYDSVVTAMHRAEFQPERIYSLKNNHLERQHYDGTNNENIYFLDRRVLTINTQVILDSKENDNNLESILGNSIFPIIQQDGIWDIDYIWQVPIVERWLKLSNFTEGELPYEKKQSQVEDKEWKKTAISNNYHQKTKVLITTVPFGVIDSKPLQLLNNTNNIEYLINPIGRKLKENETAELAKDFDIIIAGTETYSRSVLENAKRLKLICRVGIGLDGIDLHVARELGINVSYTPEAPAPAVAELTIGHMINLLRKLPFVDRKLRSGIWQRNTGERIANMTIGIIGTGRIGSRIIKHLQGFNPRKIIVNDIQPDRNLYEMYHVEHVDKETIYRESDIITVHVPLTKLTKSMISSKEIDLMKPNISLINTSRGGIINEADLYEALLNHRIGGAAIDVFESEPYNGKLTELDNCFLSCHMGSMTSDCRARMEIEATEEALRFIKGEALKQLVPQNEYEN